MTWTSGRRRPHDRTWILATQAVRERAAGRCEYVSPGGLRCPNPGREVDHIIPWAEGGPSTLDNAWFLCKPHHDDKTQAEARRAAMRARTKATRPSERHPLDY